MLGFIIFLHVVVCILLSLMILMQSGRGGGLAESFSAAESMFGARTNVVLVKATTVLGAFFIVTCLSLAFFSAQGSKSLIEGHASKTAHTAAEGGIPVASSQAKQEIPTAQGVATETKQEASKGTSIVPKTETQPVTNSTIPANHK